MKILYVSTVGITMRFFPEHVKMLMEEGHTVELACNDTEYPIPDIYRTWGVKTHTIPFSRSPLSASNVTAYKQLKKLVTEGNYDIVHTHTPNASAIVRLACRKLRKKKGLKVYYTAHGFHFYKGAPAANWLLYYPVEKLCAHWTDMLITINKEDYALAQAKMKAKLVEYVPGIGVDVDKFKNTQVDRAAKRKELGIPEDAFLLLSVGELNQNKNHQIVMKALFQTNEPNIHYMIAGEGELHDSLLAMAEQANVSERVHLLGYRKDIDQLNRVSDLFILPSYREGLNVSLIEAVASGTDCIASRIRGNVDIMQEKTDALFSPFDANELQQLILKKYQSRGCNPEARISAEMFSTDYVNKKMVSLYNGK